jgi:hypothetical protein
MFLGENINENDESPRDKKWHLEKFRWVAAPAWHPSEQTPSSLNAFLIISPHPSGQTVVPAHSPGWEL